MMGRRGLSISAACLCTLVSVSFGARMRPAGDPSSNRIIWAEPFDNWDEADHIAGNLWRGGPWPPGSESGTYPGRPGCGAVKDPGWIDDYYRGNLSPDSNCTDLNVPFALEQCVFDVYKDENCSAGSGQVLFTQPFAGQYNAAWVRGTPAGEMWWTPLGMFSYDLAANRLGSQFVSRSWDAPGGDAVNGTDAHPLTLVFYLDDQGTMGTNPRDLFDNCYIELNMSGDHAPTDYIWRGDPNSSGAEGCPQGPYPIICQQVREVNGSVSEDGSDLAYLNANCPPLVPEFDPNTGTGKTWRSIAFGFLAIGDKDPCGFAEQGADAHVPTKDHMMLFDGNKWRELRSGRGLGLATCPPAWGTSGPEGQMTAGTGSSGDFSLNGGSNRIYLKLTSSQILIWMSKGPYLDRYDTTASGQQTHYCGAFPRVYTGPFNRISFGVAPGCELDSASYVCKTGGTPKRCIRYSQKKLSDNGPGGADGYNRTMFDNCLLLDGIVVNSTSPDLGACCVRTGANAGTCSENKTSAECTALGGIWHGMGSTCGDFKCCPLPFADKNGDGAVDQNDFGALQVCYTGDAGGVPTGCACFDTNNDGAVNGTDVTAFLNCWTGPNVPWTAALTPLCVP